MLKLEDIEKKIRSFSEHNGLGKTYHYYELTDTSRQHFVPAGGGDKLPRKVLINIRPDRKTEWLFTIIVACICLLVMSTVKERKDHNFIYFAVLCFGGVVTLGGWVQFGRDKKVSTLILDNRALCFNKDIFPYEDVETAILKKDIAVNNKLVAYWLMVVLKNGDIYSYQIPNRYSWLRIRGRYKLEDLLYHYRENRQVNALFTP